MTGDLVKWLHAEARFLRTSGRRFASSEEKTLVADRVSEAAKEIERLQANVELLQQVVVPAIRWKVEMDADDDDFERFEAQEALLAAVRDYLNHRPEPTKSSEHHPDCTSRRWPSRYGCNCGKGLTEKDSENITHGRNIDPAAETDGA